MLDVLMDDNSYIQHQGCGVRLEDGSEHALAVLYGGYGCDVNLWPAHTLGMALDEKGYVRVVGQQMTGVEGVCASGDLVSDFDQCNIALSQATAAAIALHNCLGEEEGYWE